MIGTEFHHCIASGLLERVKELVRSGISVQLVDSQYYDQSALMTACRCVSNSNIDIVAYLVECGANVTFKTQSGMTPLLCSTGCVATVKYLVAHGANFTDRCRKGRTVLHYAVQCGNLLLVQYLLSSEVGASDITETDNTGCTALLMAKEPVMVKWLLEYGGANIADVDNAGRSVWGTESFLSSTFYHHCTSEMVRVMVLHGAAPAWLASQIPGPLKRILEDGIRLRYRLPDYLRQRRIFVDSHCLQLLPPLLNLVHEYAELTTDEYWELGLHKI
jgi:hypothetical protein